MSQPVQFLLMFILLAPFWYRLSRDFISALSYGMVILIACTHFLRIPLPGALPELTIHRIIIISLFLAWIRMPKQMRLKDVPLARHILVWSLVAFVSLLGSIDHTTSIKRYFDYVLEFFLLYFILSTTIQNRGQAIRILQAACLGLVIVAVLAFIEKYTGVNPVDQVAPLEEDSGAIGRGSITATYRHRILLGTGMAMGFPLAFWFSQTRSRRGSQILFWMATVAMLSACYFARSRGPWLAAALAGGFIVLCGSSTSRKRIIGIGIVAALLLLARPGVLGTIAGLAEATADSESFKGGTFQYRLELWRVAISETTKSFGRFLFGYGPGAGATSSIDWTLSYRGRDFEVTSWDNDLAYSLYQYGFLGLGATLVLYTTLVSRFYFLSRKVSGAERDFFICLAASALVLFFMMSNVMIFARQLYYLLWTVAACGFIVGNEASREAVEESEIAVSAKA